MGDAVTQRWSGVLRTLASLRGGTFPPEQHLTTTSGGQEGIGASPPPPPIWFLAELPPSIHRHHFSTTFGNGNLGVDEASEKQDPGRIRAGSSQDPCRIRMVISRILVFGG